MLVYFFSLLILEIIFIILGYKDKKFFKVFNGMFFGFFVSVFLYCLYAYTDIFSYDTGAWVTLEALLKSAALSIFNLIIGIVGLILQKKIQNKQISNNSRRSNIIIYFLIVLLISSVFIFSQYLIKKNEKEKIENEIERETLVYLNNKYGSSDFKIIDIDRDFAANGFIGTDYLENYDIYAIYIPNNTRFYIYLDVDDQRNILKDSFDDSLISTNYSEKYFKDNDFINDSNKKIEELNVYLKGKKLKVDVSLYSKYVVGLDNNKAVPNSYGKIPSKDELYNLILDYHIKHDFKIDIDKNEIRGDDLKFELKTYLINVANNLINYYGDLDDYKIECHYKNDNGKFFNGRIIINKEYIDIDGNLIEERIKR